MVIGGDEKRSWLTFSNLVALWTFIQIVGSIVVTIVKWAAGSNISVIEIVLLGAFVIQFLIIFYAVFWRKFSFKAYDYPVVNNNYGYFFVEKVYNYVLEEGDVLNFSRTAEIESCQCNLDGVYDKYIWTGNESANIPTCECDEVCSTELIDRYGIWRYYRITFKNGLGKGCRLKYTCQWPRIHNCTSSSAFVSASTDVPVKKLVFNLNLGKKYANRKIVLEEYYSISDDFPFKTPKYVLLDSEGKYQWVVPNISRGRHYRIRWDWNNGDVSKLNQLAQKGGNNGCKETSSD